MNNLYFIIPPEQGKMPVTGTVAERVVEGLYLCFYGGDPVVGRLTSVDAMLNWQLFANPRDLNIMLVRYSQAAQALQTKLETPAEEPAEAVATS